MPAPIPLSLSEDEKHELEQIRKHSRSPRVWTRATALLLLSAGEPVSKVAKAFSVCPDTVTRWKRRFLSRDTFRLDDLPHPGRPPTVTEEYLRLLEEAVLSGPQACGYGFTVWSAARLSSHLAKKTGIAIGTRQVRFWLRRIGFVYGCPKHTLSGKQDPKEVEAAKAQLAALKRGPWTLLRASIFGSRTKASSTSTPTSRGRG